MTSRELLVGLTIMALATVAWPSAAEGDSMLAVGDDFVDFELPAHDGTTVRSEDLAGRPFLLFYYVKADTPG